MLCSSEEDLGHCRTAWPQQTPANIPQTIARALLQSPLRLSALPLDVRLPALPLVPRSLSLGAKSPDFRAIPKHSWGLADMHNADEGEDLCLQALWSSLSA